MSGGQAAERVQKPAAQAQASTDDEQLHGAATTTTTSQDANPLASDDGQLSALLEDGLRISDRMNDISGLCKTYIQSKDEKDGEKTVSASKQTEFSVDVASRTVLMLLDHANDDLSITTKGNILIAICSRANGAKSLANLIHERPTEVFRAFWKLGIVDAFVQILMQPDAWASKDDQAKGVKEAFALLMSTLLEPETTDRETAMRSIAKLMAAHASVLENLIDDENLAILLSFLDLELPIVLKSQATLTIAKFLEASPQRGQEMLKVYVVSRFGRNLNDELVAATSVAGAIFPIIPTFAATLFLTPGFLEDLVQTKSQSRSDRLRQATLELLSAACINKDCRVKVFKVCKSWLEQILCTNGISADKTMAGLILSKLRQQYHSDSAKENIKADVLDKLVPLFKDLVLNSEEQELQTAIEGLAYNSIDPTVKEKLAMDTSFLKRMVKIVMDKISAEPANRGPLLFGSLTILSNLTTYPASLSAEEKRMAQLKAYANQTKFPEPSALDDETHVSARCRKVLDADVASLLVTATKNTSPAILNLTSMILCSLSNTREHCGLMAQQGMLDTVLRLAHMDQVDAAGILPHARRQSAHALARTLTSINPHLLFTNGRSIQRCIGPLNYLLSQSEPSHPHCAFNSLQALTNLAVLDEHSARLICDKCFPSIAVFLESPRSALQQAATECVCNLCHKSDHFLEKYYVVDLDEPEPYGPDFDSGNASADGKEVRFLRLIWLTSSKARGTRLSAMGALAFATSLESGIRMILRAPEGIEQILEALAKAQSLEAGQNLGLNGDAALVGDEDMRLRATCLIKEVCCRSDDIEVHRRLVRNGLMRLLNEGKQHLPDNDKLKELLLAYTEDMVEKLKKVLVK